MHQPSSHQCTFISQSVLKIEDWQWKHKNIKAHCVWANKDECDNAAAAGASAGADSFWRSLQLTMAIGGGDGGGESAQGGPRTKRE